jgi:hypothetical protein
VTIVLSASPRPETGLAASAFASSGPAFADVSGAPVSDPNDGVLGEAMLPPFDASPADGRVSTSSALFRNLVGFAAELQ